MLFHDVDHARLRLPSHTWRRTEIKAGGNHKLMPASLIERVQTGRVLAGRNDRPKRENLLSDKKMGPEVFPRPLMLS